MQKIEQTNDTFLTFSYSYVVGRDLISTEYTWKQHMTFLNMFNPSLLPEVLS